MGYNIFLPRWKAAQRSHVIEEDQRQGLADLGVCRRRWLLAGPSRAYASNVIGFE